MGVRHRYRLARLLRVGLVDLRVGKVITLVSIVAAGVGLLAGWQLIVQLVNDD